MDKDRHTISQDISRILNNLRIALDTMVSHLLSLFIEALFESSDVHTSLLHNAEFLFDNHCNYLQDGFEGQPGLKIVCILLE